MVQRKLARRTKGKNRHSGVHLLSGRIKCGDCGGWYGSKVWHSNSKYRRVIWQCNRKFKNETKCTTPHVDEEILKERFLQAVSEYMADPEERIEGLRRSVKQALDSANDRELKEACEDLTEALNAVGRYVDPSDLDDQDGAMDADVQQ